ncbi:hypothetical protein [Arthrobacter antioxidans]|uniref:hypothetical protein n=1 Tax=Arthrobacter antioxidans TaxID=2895818 RepID=UPI001FFF72C2|nr:hypothetical protein [Arthrobacter antioxidans]
MTRSAWAITAALVGLALVAVWFFGLDPRHGVVLVGAACAAGIANGVLEAVDIPRIVLPRPPEPERGLADLQALEFSLASTDPGMRAVLEVHTLARSVAAARPGTPRSDALDAFVAEPRPSGLTHRELQALGAELERIVLSPAPHPTSTRHQEAP